jgi:hypothetical protein
MKAFVPTQKERALGITIRRDGCTVYADPLCRSLFDPEELCELPKGQKLGRLFEGKHSYFLFRRDFLLRSVAYSLYVALPVHAEELSDPVALDRIAQKALRDLELRFAFVLSEANGELAPLSSLPLRSYFSSLCSEICSSLYAPLVIDIANVSEDPSVRVHPTCLSKALGLALAAMLREGQSTLSFRLSEEEEAFALSFVGERPITSDFVHDLLDALAERGGFLVRHTPFGVTFHLLPSHRPAAILRAQDDLDDIHLREGFFLL